MSFIKEVNAIIEGTPARGLVKMESKELAQFIKAMEENASIFEKMPPREQLSASIKEKFQSLSKYWEAEVKPR